jgi:hypothetical protein
MSVPDSRRWVANDWRSVWQVMCLRIEVFRTASRVKFEVQNDRRVVGRVCFDYGFTYF